MRALTLFIFTYIILITIRGAIRIGSHVHALELLVIKTAGAKEARSEAAGARSEAEVNRSVFPNTGSSVPVAKVSMHVRVIWLGQWASELL